MTDYLHRRIDRAYVRMIAAKTDSWAHAWGDVFVRLVNRRNAKRSRAETRQLERERGLA